MADARDILGLPKAAVSKDILGGSAEKKGKLSKEAVKKPDGVSREVFALTGGMPPAMPALDSASIKRRQAASSKKIAWRWHPFSTSARTDNLQLHHWVRVVDGHLPVGDYAFAKYNKSVEVVRYTDEEYSRYLTDPGWSRQETDQLFDLCEQFDLRFIIIADRFPSDRTVEELKHRYYSVAKAIIISRAVCQEDVADHTLVKDNYEMSQEVERKRALGIMMCQTRQQGIEDAKVLEEAKRIMASRLSAKAVEEAEPSFSQPALESPKLSSGVVEKPPKASASQSSSPAPPVTAPAAAAAPAPPPVQPATAAEPVAVQSSPLPATEPIVGAAPTANNGPRLPRIFLRAALLQQSVHAIGSSAGVRTGKRVDQTLEELGVRPKPRVPTAAVCAEHLELRREILTMINLQKQLQWKENEIAVLRDNPYADVPATPTTPKRAHRGGDFERVSTRATTVGADPGTGTGERLGKREHKRKAPARFAESPASPPQQKRARKMKASEM